MKRGRGRGRPVRWKKRTGVNPLDYFAFYDADDGIAISAYYPRGVSGTLPLLLDVVIPTNDHIDKQIVAIDPLVFRDMEITSITFMGRCKIGSGAFSFCAKLTSVSVPSSPDSDPILADSCFAKCTGITTVIIDPLISMIDYQCFLGAPITSITLGDGVSFGDSTAMGVYGAEFIDYYRAGDMVAGTYKYDIGTSSWHLE